MILTISHVTTYRYARAVTLQPHRLMLRPRGQQDLTLKAMSIECSPTASMEWTQDVFGNVIATAAFSEPSDGLTISSRAVVDHSAAEWPVFSIAPSAHQFPFSYSPEEAIDLGALRTPQHVDVAERLKSWVAGFRVAEPRDTLTLLSIVNAAIAQQFSYRARAEEGTQSPGETIAAESGSCRDFATLFIEAVRQLGFGARAVSGYIQPAMEPGAEQHGATHAWAEVYLPCAGWIAFDPTHARLGGAGLIPVACARTIEQIRPVEGSYIGGADDFLDMSVEVTVKAGTVQSTRG